jgi:hypothetical protein
MFQYEVVEGMADQMSAWETGITCQAEYNLEQFYTFLDKHSLVVEDFWCDLV